MSDPVIELRDVRLGFGGEPILDGFSIAIAPGETTVIMGPSGCGKSLIIRLMAGLLHPDAGQVWAFGKNLAELSGDQLLAQRRDVGMMFQSYALLDSIDVFDNVAFPLREGSDTPADEIEARVLRLLELLELEDARDRFPADLSGGMKKRVSLARALVTDPKVVLFDEPTTGLDPIMISFVDGYIQRLQDSFDITSVIISHDIASAFRLGDSLAMIHGGRCVFHGSREQARACTDPRVKGFISVPATARPAQRPVVAMGDPVVRFVDVHKSFGENHVLRGVTFAVPEGLTTVVIGASGSGKSVIIKHIMGLIEADRGEVWVFDEDVAKMSAARLAETRRRFGMLFQSAALFDSMTIGENVAFPLVERRGGPPPGTARKVLEVLERLRIADLAGRYPSQISGGERKRAGLARAMVLDPPVIIYDEPTTGLDPILVAYTDELIQEVQREFDVTSIIISHDMDSTFRVAHRIVMIHEGRVVACGAPAEVRALAEREPAVHRFIYAGEAALAAAPASV